MYEAALEKRRITMKIAVSADGPTLDAQVDPRFGRCAYFLIVNPDTLDSEAVENPNDARASGAGIQSAELMAAKDVKCVLTGHCGPNAQQALAAAGIDVVSECSGTVRNVVARFEAGELRSAGKARARGDAGRVDPSSTAAGTFAPSDAKPVFGAGMGQRRGAGGGGGGRRRGRGGGMGMGRGGGRSRNRG